MVQYVFTPWRDRHELLLVRRQFYAAQLQPSSSSSSANTNISTGSTSSRPSHDEAPAPAPAHAPVDVQNLRLDQHQAVARVSMWMQRGHCPHMVESTALLTAAVLSDEEDVDVAAQHTASSTYAIRAAYSAAFSRFVTGLLDGHQDKQRKQSMYAIAKTIGLPAAFVELRHQSTHEQLPSRAKLRSAAIQALAWIWDYYWKHLPEDEGGMAARDQGPKDACTEEVLHYLRQDDEARRQQAMKGLRRWPREQLLKSVAEVRKSLPGNQAYIKCMKFYQDLLNEESEGKGEDSQMEDSDDNAAPAPQPGEGQGTRDQSQANAVEETLASQSEQLDTGWSRYEGPWKAKPIGFV